MLWGEYNYDEDIAAQRQEAFDEGIQQKAIETAKNAIAMHLKTEEIVKLTGLSLDVIQSLQNN